jgi:GT2 family glycosyltransferase
MSLISSPGVPRLIHQTWRDHNVPTDNGDPDSWKVLNPDWTYKLWTDEDLLNLVQLHFPELLTQFNAYPNPVQRADLGRYCILKIHGGVYADIDTICHQSLEPLAGDLRVILCEEPEEKGYVAHLRGLDKLYFNGTMASPAGHPFWDRVLEICTLMVPVSQIDVLESTGPLVLSAVVEQWPNQSQLALSSCHLFACLTTGPEQSRALKTGPFGHITISTHLWQGSWYKQRKESLGQKIRGQIAKTFYTLRSTPKLNFEEVEQSIDYGLLHSEIPTANFPAVTILIPVRNAESYVEHNMQQILALDYPKDQIRIAYGEGESSDRTSEIITSLISRYGSIFASIESVKLARNGPTLARNMRWKAKHQYHRRAGLAKARNDLLKAALTEDATWVLWLDADVVSFPSDIIQRLLAELSKIVTPNCVLVKGGPSYDLNAFLEIGQPFAVHYYRHLKNGLFQPPADFWFRRHLSNLRYLDRVPLHGVGCTMLLVQADVHRSGLNFPEVPYKDVLETEAFGYLARDLGVAPLGLPNVEIIHTNS